LAGTTQLTRTEYLDPDANPRDRDQVDSSVNLRFSSKPYKKLSANINLAYSASEFINIDASQSENNRTRDLYELRPGFTYSFSDRFIITQTYGISIEYTDYIYKPTSNFLDRNLTFSNRFDFKPAKRITFIFDYAYNFHDNGSYLPDEETGEEALSVQGEDRRDRINLRVDYRVMTRVKQVSPTESLNRTLAVFAEQRYSRFEDREILSGRQTESQDGQITVGTRGDYDFGTGRMLKFTLARVQRFSKFGSEAEKNYWDMRSEFNYPF
jgi:outer membrane receptor protein involved in Fe transport